MSKYWIFPVIFILLLSNTPCFFHEPVMDRILGFPPWAFYSLVMMIIYAVVTCIFMSKYWTSLAEDADLGSYDITHSNRVVREGDRINGN